jgi:hypothetical protein
VECRHGFPKSQKRAPDCCSKCSTVLIWCRRLASDYSSGYLPDTIDPKDFIFTPYHPAWYGKWLLPRVVDLSRSPFMPPTLNQGSIGSCTANATANAIRYTVRRDTNGKGDFMPRWDLRRASLQRTSLRFGALPCRRACAFVNAIQSANKDDCLTALASFAMPPCHHCSRLFIYFHARYGIMGKGRGEEGAFLRACCKSLAKYGVSKEQLWPYQAQHVDGKPSARESNGSK